MPDDEVPASGGPHGLPSSAPKGGAHGLPKVVDIPMRSEEESRRYYAMASARNELLSQVQQLQSNFYATYHRWAEVPGCLVDDPPPRAPPEVRGDVPERSNEGEREEKARLLADLFGPAAPPPSSASDAIAALRRSVKVERPTLRPSRDEEGEGVAKQPPCHPLDTSPPGISSKALRQAPFSAPDTSSDKFQNGGVRLETNASLVGKLPHAQAANGVSIAPPDATFTRNVITKETIPPSNRRGRWEMVQYDDDSNGEE
ncbi:unnamed protein product [Phytomonas sp. EM1]|nr:unnamed protein product [Phytomonas sp. EM1]|eukprot:CCW59965.1 unnamed protein product [Phytomonas sp. isolate EM1]